MLRNLADLGLVLKLAAEELVGGFEEAEVRLGKKLVALALEVVLHKLGEPQQCKVDQGEQVAQA